MIETIYIMNNEDLEKNKESSNEDKLIEVWKKEIENSINYYRNWVDEAKKYEAIYEDEHNNANGESNRYNIFYSNVETLAPLIFSKLPNPNVTRRFANDDKASRIASELLERSLDYCLDVEKSEIAFAKARKDFLITGRGLVRVYYDEAEIIKLENENGEIEEEFDDSTKKVALDYVHWADFLTSTEKTWEDIRWISFRHKKTKKQIETQFGKKIADKVSYNSSMLTSIDSNELQGLEDVIGVAEVYEIWDKTNKRVVWIANIDTDSILLSVDDDPYELMGFFPIPRPLGSDSTNNSILPIPTYRMYKGQAEELNRLDQRIKALIEQVKYSGVYSSISESQDLKNLLNGCDGEFNALKGLQPGQNIKDLIYTKDIIPIVNAIAQLNDQKARVINNIREITGLSDIVRGVTVASETATAQRLKGDFAISRIQPLQKAMELMIRDVIELQGELLVENYDIAELAKMTNLMIVDIDLIAQQAQDQQNRLLQEAVQQVSQDPNIAKDQIAQLEAQQKAGLKKTLAKPKEQLRGYAVTPQELQEVDNLLKNDKLRTFSINIETDSTVAIDQNKVKQDRIEYISAITNFSSQFVPLVQAGIIQTEAFNKFLAFMSQPFKVGRNLEESLLAEPEQEEQEQPTAEEMLAQAESARKDQELQLKIQELQLKASIEQQKVNIEKAKVQQSQIQFEDKIDFEDANKAADRQKDLVMQANKTAFEIGQEAVQNAGQAIKNTGG